MKKSRNFLVALLCICMIAGTLTACSGSTGTKSESKTTGNATFIFAGPNNITTWDPQNENKSNAYMLSKLVYNTLVNPYGKNGAIQPELATSWTVSADGKTWSFKLRSGVKFSNGEPFDSSCVVATLQRLLTKKTLVQAAFWPLLSSVSAPNPQTAVITLTASWGALLNELVDTPMLPAKALAEKGDKLFDFNDTTHPIGTGPWVCSKWTPGQDAIFVRNEDYWDWGNSKSNVAKLIYRPVTEDTTRVSGIQTGDLDMIDAVPVEQAALLKSVKGVKVMEMNSYNVVHLGFRTVNSIFSDVNARQAVNHALDRNSLVSSIAGGGKASSWPCPEGVIGFDPTSQVPKYDVALAKQYLAKTKYNGEEISIIAPTGVFARSKEISQVVLAMVTAAGFKAKLEILENASFQDRRAAGKYDIYVQRYPFPCGDPDSVITQRWLQDSGKSGYVNKELNDLILQSKSEVDATKRAALLKKVFAIEWDQQAPHTTLYNEIEVLAYRSNISGIKFRKDNVTDYSRVMKG